MCIRLFSFIGYFILITLVNILGLLQLISYMATYGNCIKLRASGRFKIDALVGRLIKVTS